MKQAEDEKQSCATTLCEGFVGSLARALDGLIANGESYEPDSPRSSSAHLASGEACWESR